MEREVRSHVWRVRFLLHLRAQFRFVARLTAP